MYKFSVNFGTVHPYQFHLDLASYTAETMQLPALLSEMISMKLQVSVSHQQEGVISG